MIIFPAIDIRSGRCVRLLQGRQEAQTDYGIPAEMARRWADQGAQWLHVVDLDGSFTGTGHNQEAIRAICAAGVPVQLGGGIRTLEDIKQRLSLGVTRIILGTITLENPDLVQEACRAFPGRVVCGIDAKDGRVAVRGWVEESDTDVFTLAARMREMGVTQVIYTDIARDGMLQGPNLPMTARLVAESGLDVIASGGIGSLEDLRAVRDIGCYGAITGKALYEGRFTLIEAIEAGRKEEKK